MAQDPCFIDLSYSFKIQPNRFLSLLKMLGLVRPQLCSFHYLLLKNIAGFFKRVFTTRQSYSKAHICPQATIFLKI